MTKHKKAWMLVFITILTVLFSVSVSGTELDGGTLEEEFDYANGALSSNGWNQVAAETHMLIASKELSVDADDYVEKTIQTGGMDNWNFKFNFRDSTGSSQARLCLQALDNQRCTGGSGDGFSLVADSAADTLTFFDDSNAKNSSAFTFTQGTNYWVQYAFNQTGVTAPGEHLARVWANTTSIPTDWLVSYNSSETENNDKAAQGNIQFGSSAAGGQIALVDNLVNMTAPAVAAQDFLNWTVTNIEYKNITTETINTLHNLTLKWNTSQVAEINVTLEYNGTNYTGVRQNWTNETGIMIANFSFSPIPQLVPTNQTNVTFHWNINVSYLSGSSEKNVTSTETQTIHFGYSVRSDNFNIVAPKQSVNASYENIGNATIPGFFVVSNSSLINTTPTNTSNFFEAIWKFGLLQRSTRAQSRVFYRLNMTVQKDGFEFNRTQKNKDGGTGFIVGTLPNHIRFTARRVIDPAGLITNFTIIANNPQFNLTYNFTTVDGSLNLSLIRGDWNFSIHAPDHNLSSIRNTTININDSINDTSYQWSLFTTNSINFSFYDEQNRTLLSSGPNIQLELISDLFSSNATVTNGNLYLDLLTPTTYTIRFSKPGYGRIREHIFTLTNQSNNVIDLYLLRNDQSTETTVVVYDEVELNQIEGVTVYLKRYRVDTNEYFTVGMGQTDQEGKFLFDIEHSNEFYRFQVDKPLGTTRLSTKERYVDSTTINLYFNTTATIGTNFYAGTNITWSISFDDTTKTFRLVYNDAENVANQYCFRIKKFEQYDKSQLNETCSSGNANTLEMVLNHQQNVTYSAEFYADIGTEERLIAVGFTELQESNLNSGEYGAYLTTMLVSMMYLFSSLHPLTLILGTSGLVFAKVIGTITIEWQWILGLMLFAVIFSLFMEAKKKR